MSTRLDPPSCAVGSKNLSSPSTTASTHAWGVPEPRVPIISRAGTPHAWVLAVVDGEDKFFDLTAELNASSKTDTYTTERWY